jgi:hypothetical protein
MARMYSSSCHYDPTHRTKSKLTFGGSLIASTPHQVRNILQQKVGRWLTDSRILKYEAILLEKDGLVLMSFRNYLNPVEFLLRGKTQDPMGHCCLDPVVYQTKIRPNLRETPFLERHRLLVEGSFGIIQGKRRKWYSVVDGIKLKVSESGRLPNNWNRELFTLNQALKFLKDEEGMIYSDSKYAFRVSHTFREIWAERSLLNSKGKELIIRLLENFMLPEEIAIIHVPRHQ